MTTSLDIALAGVPTAIRKKLIDAYMELKRNLAESRQDAAGMSAGKLCEVALRLLQDRSSGSHTPFGTKIPNFADECRKIITSSKSNAITNAEKQVIPRALVFLYTMRNTRGIGHIGGDVDPNAVDGSVMASTADWIVCELIRVHHGMSLEDAQDLVDALAVRRLPDIWDVAGKKRVLSIGLPVRDEVLLLIYSTKESALLTEDLLSWVEYSNASLFKSNILAKLHKERFIEWDRQTETVMISPKGAADVENRLLKPQKQGTSSSRAKSAPRKRIRTVPI